MFNRIKEIKEIPTRAFVRMQTASLPAKTETKSARAITQVVPHTAKDRAAVALGAGFAVALYGLTVQAFAANEGLTKIVDNVTTFAMYLLATMSVLMAVAAGLMFVTSGGNSKVINRAKETVKYVVIGIVLVLVLKVGKDVLVNLIGGATGGKNGAGDSLSKNFDARNNAAGGSVAPPK